MKLIAVLEKAKAKYVYLDGSFTSSKPRPGDVDVCWKEGTGSRYEYEFKHAPILVPTPKNRKFHKEVFKADVFPADIYETDSGLQFLAFFQRDKTTGETKGILKIEL
jgi:hypothetical protein